MARLRAAAPAEHQGADERKPGPALSAKPKDADRRLRCEQHGKFWNVASCPSCDALKWQDDAYRAMTKASAAVN